MIEASSHAGRRSPIVPARRDDLALLLGALVIGAAWRLPGVGEAFLFGDELHTLFELPRGFAHLLSHFSATGSGLALPLLQRLLVDAFGPNHWAIRAPAWIPGLLLLPATFVVVRSRLGDRVAIGATWLVAVSPLLIFYSRFARSYALVALLVLLLLDRVDAALEEGRLGARRFAALALLAGAAAWAHPTALGSVAPVMIAGALAARFGRGPRPEASRDVALGLLAALAAGGLLCAALHWPARESLLAFVSTKTSLQVYEGAFGTLDVAALATGSRMAAIGLGLLALGAAAGTARARGWRSAPLLAAAFAPPLVIAAVRPYGDAYAYARYLIAALPPLFVLSAWGLDRLLAAASKRAGERSAWVTAALALILLGAGPPASFLDATPQHANTYLGLRTLPAFDAPWPGAPGFYEQLAAEHASTGTAPVLVEVPALTTRTRHLLRQHQRQHGGRTLLGPLPGEFPSIPAGPYVPVHEPGRLESSGADYVVVHLDVSAEIARYWAWVYGAENAPARPGADAAYLARHERYGGLLPRPDPRLLASLARRFGKPVYVDDSIVVHGITPAD